MDKRYLSGRQPRPPAERRTQTRLRVQLPARASDGHSWRVHDISRAGLSLVTDRPLPEGTSLDLELIDTASGRSCRFQAQVVWTAPGEPGRAGLRFSSLTPEQDAWLASRFMEWMAAGHEVEE
jgi:PilZ domain-containing protein